MSPKYPPRIFPPASSTVFFPALPYESAFTSREPSTQKTAITVRSQMFASFSFWIMRASGFEICCAITVDAAAGEIIVDYEGSSGASPFGINVVKNYTHAYTTFTVRSVLNPDVPNNTVVQVVQTGYVIGERVLRPAMVGVARGGPKQAADQAAPAEPGPPNAQAEKDA